MWNCSFTSESVGEGHPDKIADQVSDAILDACLKDDPLSKVACETATKTGMIMVFGEITTKTKIDYQKVIRNAIKDIGYDDSNKGFDYKTCNVLVAIEEQSADIAQGLHYEEALERLGAGDQGIMFGYATDETPELLPLTIQLAHKLNKAMKDARQDGSLPWLRPDTKTQVTVEYEHDGGAVVPKRVDTVVVSAQHSEHISTEQLRKEIKEKIIKTSIPEKYLDDKTVYHVGWLQLTIAYYAGSADLYRSNRPASSSLAAHKEMLVSPVERSLSTPTAAGAHTAAAPSPVRTTARWTVRPPTSPAGSPSPLSSPALLVVLSSSSLTLLVWPSRYQYSSKAMARQTRAPTSWWRSFATISTCDRV